MHKSDQITRKGLERISCYCQDHSCQDCRIHPICSEFQGILYNLHSNVINASIVPRHWSYSDMTKILKITRNSMEATFIESLEKILRHNSQCYDVNCMHCPFSWIYDGDNDCCRENNLSLHYYEIEFKETAKMLLEYYKGEME